MKSESDLRKEALGSVEMWEDLDMKSENRGGWVGGCLMVKGKMEGWVQNFEGRGAVEFPFLITILWE